ncbi:MAG: DUF1015 domain-containing protein [Gammaproteobacteria bacterium]
MHKEFLARPFPALRPTKESAVSVIAPPYDVINLKEAKELAEGKPFSFLRVSRAELEMPNSTGQYAPEVYERAAKNLQQLKQEKVLIQDEKPAYYVYRISNANHTQIGVALSASVDAYDKNKIRKHELTRHAKETDRTNQISAVKAITGPVLLAHREQPALDQLLLEISSNEASDYEGTVDGWLHEIWVVKADNLVAEISSYINSMPALYIADGHHRSAAASRVAKQRLEENSDLTDDNPCHGFLAVSFSQNAMRILDYNRVITDLNGRSAREFIKPQQAKEFGMYLDGSWYLLSLKNEWSGGNSVSMLDVSVLNDTIIDPILAIEDSRTDQRIDFIGGSRGTQAIEEVVNSGSMAVGFTLFPTKMSELMAVADAGLIMPPKSTWFEPKLADGLLSLVL